ncbi:MAG TPA: heavy metal translocating P-type ATPase [Thermoplasmata archaeon]|nr:heavy metal translocating P-type ATPase [Thermoplasmata archaeon]
MATDPVCGMFVEERAASLHLVRDNRTYYFCSETCRDQFADPARAQRALARRLAIAWPLALIVVGLTYGLGSRDAIGLAAALATVVQFYVGLPFYRGARDAIADRSWNMDLLIAVGSSAAYAYSLAALLLPSRLPASSYFDASSLIVTLILTGNYLEHLTRSRAGSALARLGDLLPSIAAVVVDGVEREVPVAEVRVGDRLRVRPGARFPTDGVIRDGSTTVEESILTGESAPVAKGVGDRVIAGAVNVDGFVTVESTAVGADTFVAQVGRLLTEAEMSRVPLKRTADRIASAFVPFVLALATAAAIGWVVLGHAGVSVGLLVFVSVVIIACPCAFGLATPAAILVGTGRAADEGVLFRGEDAIERAARIDLVVTDKTGTLTLGRPQLVSARPLDGVSEVELIGLAAAVETGSEHPIARAILDAARARSIAIPPATSIRIQPGRGVLGVVRSAPIEVRRWEPDTGAAEAGAASAIVGELEGAGSSVVVVYRDGRPIGLLGLADRVRAGVPEAIRYLRSERIPVVMATGDAAEIAGQVAREVGIGEVHAGLLPEEKLTLVRSLRAGGHKVAVVGDGVNDAPALAAADLGIALGSGSDVARDAGQVVLVRPDFRGVGVALDVARRTVAKVRSNFAWAFGYNLVLLPIAAGALVPLLGLGIYGILPIAGALAMALSSTLVVLNSLSLRGIPTPSIAAVPAVPGTP